MIIVLEPADLALGLLALWVNDMGAEWFRQMYFVHRGSARQGPIACMQSWTAELIRG
jgi:hypothetical protein